MIHHFSAVPYVIDPATRVAFQRPFVIDSPWNLPIASSALFADDANIRVGSANLNSTAWTTRIRQASNSDPLVTCTGGNLGTFQLRVPAGVAASNGTDGTLDIIAPDGHTHWDFYKFIRIDDTHATYVTCRQSSLSDVLTGTGWGAGGVWAGTTAAAACYMGGVLRAEELQLVGIDRIRHALQCAMAPQQLKSGTTKPQTYQWPAISSDGSWAAYSGTIPIGALLAIPPSIDITALVSNPDAQALAWCLQNFGVYVVNKGGDPGACILFAETEGPEAIIGNMRASWATIRNQLRLVTNSTQATPAGKTAAGVYPPALYPSPTPVAVPSA